MQVPSECLTEIKKEKKSKEENSREFKELKKKGH